MKFNQILISFGSLFLFTSLDYKKFVVKNQFMLYSIESL